MRYLAFVLALAASAGCGEASMPVVDITCEADEDCADFESRFCGDGLCREIPVPCETDADCPKEGRPWCVVDLCERVPPRR